MSVISRHRRLRTYGAAAVLPTWALLPAALCVVFMLIYLTDRARGGYRVERLEGGEAGA